MKIEFTEEELNALIGLMDAGLKHLGLAGATAAAIIIQKIEAAKLVEPDNYGEK